MYKNYRFFSFLLLIIVFTVFVNAIQTQVNVNSNYGLQISYPKFDAIRVNQPFNLSIHVYNVSDGKTVTTASCNLEIYSIGGELVFYSVLNNIDDQYSVFISEGNFSSLGKNSYNIYCNTTNNGGFADGLFYVNNSGEITQTSHSIFYIGVLIILVFFFAFLTYFGVNTDSLWVKAFSIGFGYLLLIAISFISWQMASNFMVSATFTIYFLKIIFLVLIIGFFPFIIALFAYGVYMAVTISEIKKMVESGIPESEAAERVRWKK